MEPIIKYSYGEIKEFCKEIENRGNPVFYRGTKVPYLLPSLVPIENRLDIFHLLKIEKQLLKLFKKIYPYKFDNDEVTNDWLYRKRAREHELVSRLVDWSHVFYKALDFATKDLKSENEYAYFWILPMAENELLVFSDLRNYPIKSISSSYMLRGFFYGKDDELASHRQFVQGGNFLVQPIHLLTQKLNEQNIFKDRLLCLSIPACCCESIREDIIKFEHEDLTQNIMIEKDNFIDKICKSLNEKLLYSANNRVNEIIKQ